MSADPRHWHDLAAENARLKASLEALSKAHLTACKSVVSERQHSALLEVENKALRTALVMFRECGCPECGGDCGSANPPVAFCPMRTAQAAIGKTHTQAEFDMKGAPK